MTKLIFTLRLILRQGMVGGSFPKTQVPFMALLTPGYLSLVAWGISLLLFSHLPLFFYFPAQNFSLFLLLLSTSQMDSCVSLSLVPGVPLNGGHLTPFVSAWKGVKGSHQARPSEGKSVSLVSSSKCCSVLPFATCSLLIYWGLFWKRK